ncbi:flagellar FlbD family protein [Thalassiella azotivora]
MIILTRLNGPRFAVNPDLLERVDTTPDTVLTLLDGTKYVVAEPMEEVIDRIRDFRASVIASARAWDGDASPADRAAERAAERAHDRAERAHDRAERAHDRDGADPGLAPAVPLRRTRRS